VTSYLGYRTWDRRLSGFLHFGGEGVDGAGYDAETGKRDDGAGLLAEVFGVAGGGPKRFQTLDLMFELIGGQVLSEADFALERRIRRHRNRIREPLRYARHDLADARLRDVVFRSEISRRNVLDEVCAVNLKVAR